MKLNYFAGPIFSGPEVFAIGSVLLLVVGFVAGLVIYIVWALFRYFVPGDTPHPVKFFRCILIGFAVVGAVTLVIFSYSAYTQIEWQKEQQRCAEQAGYSSPAENETAQATVDSQQTYLACLER